MQTKTTKILPISQLGSVSLIILGVYLHGHNLMHLMRNATVIKLAFKQIAHII